MEHVQNVLFGAGISFESALITEDSGESEESPIKRITPHISTSTGITRATK
jgi:hypothetical protein